MMFFFFSVYNLKNLLMFPFLYKNNYLLFIINLLFINLFNLFYNIYLFKILLYLLYIN